MLTEWFMSLFIWFLGVSWLTSMRQQAKMAPTLAYLSGFVIILAKKLNTNILSIYNIKVSSYIPLVSYDLLYMYLFMTSVRFSWITGSSRALFIQLLSKAPS